MTRRAVPTLQLGLAFIRKLALGILLTSTCLYACVTAPSEDEDSVNADMTVAVSLSSDHSKSENPLLTNGPGPGTIATVICNDVGIGSGIRLQIAPAASCEFEKQYPYLHMGIFDRDFRQQPEGYWYWPEFDPYDDTLNRLQYLVSGWYCREEGDCETARVAVYIGGWGGERYGPDGWSPEPELFIGRPISGWYVIELLDGTQLGNAFNGVYCGQNWDYCE